MDDNQTMLVLALLALVAWIFFYSIEKGVFASGNEDPIAARIRAIEDATFAMDDECKAKVLMAVLEGNTNNVEDIKEQVMLERVN